MSKQEQAEHEMGQRFPISEWETQMLRLTAIPNEGADFGEPPREPSWWQSLVGEPPALSTTQPRMGGHREEGPFHGGTLRMVLLPSRLDWVLGASEPSPDDELHGPPTFGNFIEARKTFQGLISKWIEIQSVPTISRLAFGAVLVHSVPSRERGYERLSAYLPAVQLDPVNSSDFLYQINRPRQSCSNTANLEINRLSKWFVWSFSSVMLLVGQEEARSSVGERMFVCRLELDINTSKESTKALDRERLPDIFKELLELGQEIAREGDVP